jgi:membrane protein
MALIVLFFSAISSIYYLGPSNKKNWNITSAGSTLATFLTIAISIGFSFFVNNFGRFNEIYGSLGTVIALQIFIYLNSFALLIGYELNISIKQSHEQLADIIAEE